jgi:MFS family permease
MVASSYFLESWYSDTTVPLETRISEIGRHLSVPLIIATMFFPVFGYAVDKIGHRLHLLMLSGTCLIASFVLFLNYPCVLALIIFGTGYGIFGTVLWPMIVFLVPERIFVNRLS